MGLPLSAPQAPAQEAFTEAFGEQVLPLLLGPGEDEVDYAAEVGSLLASLGADADDAAVWRFVEAEHRVWRPAHRIEPDVLDLLDALRERGLKVGLVSNVFDPPSLMRGLFAELGLLERLDAVALSTEVGKRKPHPAIFESALEQAGVRPAEAVMVGDRLREDVGGAQAVGISRDPGGLVRARRIGRRDAGRDRRGPRRRAALARHNLKPAGLSSLAVGRRLLSPSPE